METQHCADYLCPPSGIQAQGLPFALCWIGHGAPTLLGLGVSFWVGELAVWMACVGRKCPAVPMS